MQWSYAAAAAHALRAVPKLCPHAGAVEAAAAATRHGSANPLVATYVRRCILIHWCIGETKCNSRLSLRQVVHLEACGGFSETEVLEVAAAAERGSAHPLAAALVGAAAAAGADMSAPVTASRSLQGQVRL